jgi:hypothetical protein
MSRSYLANKEAQEKLTEAERRVHEKREEDLRQVMRTEVGRRFVYHLIYLRCGVMDDFFSGNSHDVRRGGQQSVGKQLVADLQELCPDEFLQMQSEAISAAKQRSSIRRAVVAAAHQEHD